MESKINITSDFKEYIDVFLAENSIHNLISKNDEKFLYEKHIYDSLSIKLFFEKYGFNYKTLLDIGCGGGFPCVPIAIEYPELKIIGIDSIQKKILSVENIKNKLNLKNLNLICGRAENITDKKFDIIVCRAVADLTKIVSYALPLLKNDGYFIAYKSKKASDEISNAKQILKTYNATVTDIIKYSLNVAGETYERKLICIRKKINS